MASTVLQVVTPVIREVGEDIDDAATKQQFVDWMANAVEALYNETGDWLFLQGQQSFTSAVGVSSYALGSLVAEVKGVVRDATNMNLPEITEADLARRGFDVNQAGAPTNYYISSWSAGKGTTIKLWPVPVSVEMFTVYRTTDPAALSETSTVEVPNAGFIALRNHVRAHFWMNAERADMYETYMTAYRLNVVKLKERYAFRKNQRLILERRDVPRHNTFRDAQLPGDYPRSG